MESIIEILTNFGFPIAVCIALGWYIIRRENRLEKALIDLTKAIQELNAHYFTRSE